mgnify:CR=1 FL=1
MKNSILKTSISFILISQFVVLTNAQTQNGKKIPVKRNMQANHSVKASERKFKFSVPVQNMMKFFGKWSGEMAIMKEGKSHKVAYQFIGRGAAEGNGVYIEEMYNDSILGKMRGGNLVGYDEADSKIHWFSVDNQNPPREFTGSWEGTDTLIISNKSMSKGKSYSEKIHFIFIGRDELHFSSVTTSEGKETAKASGTFNRDIPKPHKVPDASPTEEK